MTTNKQCALQKQSNISIELYYQHHITAKTGSQEVHHKQSYGKTITLWRKDFQNMKANN